MTDKTSQSKVKLLFGASQTGKFTLCIFILIVIFGCASTGYNSKGRIYTGMDRKTITKDSSGEITQKITPITVEPSYNVSCEQPENYNKFDDETYHYSSSFSLNGLGADFVSSKLSHSYTSNFQSSDFKNLDWSSNPQISGTGGEILFIESNRKNRSVSFVFGGGRFKSENEANAYNENSIYVKEKIKAASFWAYMGICAKPLPLIYLQGLLGAFSFDVDTDVETNASIYKYEGLSGNRAFPVIGISGGLESPWDYPVHLFIGTRAWLPISNDAFYENNVRQLNGGMLFNF